MLPAVVRARRTPPPPEPKRGLGRVVEVAVGRSGAAAPALLCAECSFLPASSVLSWLTAERALSLALPTSCRAAAAGLGSAFVSELLTGQSVVSQVAGRFEGPRQIEFALPACQTLAVAGEPVGCAMPGPSQPAGSQPFTCANAAVCCSAGGFSLGDPGGALGWQRHQPPLEPARPVTPGTGTALGTLLLLGCGLLPARGLARMPAGRCSPPTALLAADGGTGRCHRSGWAARRWACLQRCWRTRPCTATAPPLPRSSTCGSSCGPTPEGIRPCRGCSCEARRPGGGRLRRARRPALPRCTRLCCTSQHRMPCLPSRKCDSSFEPTLRIGRRGGRPSVKRRGEPHAPLCIPAARAQCGDVVRREPTAQRDPSGARDGVLGVPGGRRPPGDRYAAACPPGVQPAAQRDAGPGRQHGWGRRPAALRRGAADAARRPPQRGHAPAAAGAPLQVPQHAGGGRVGAGGCSASRRVWATASQAQAVAAAQRSQLPRPSGRWCWLRIRWRPRRAGWWPSNACGGSTRWQGSG